MNWFREEKNCAQYTCKNEMRNNHIGKIKAYVRVKNVRMNKKQMTKSTYQTLTYVNDIYHHHGIIKK